MFACTVRTIQAISIAEITISAIPTAVSTGHLLKAIRRITIRFGWPP
jgi:hypothetical protein